MKKIRQWWDNLNKIPKRFIITAITVAVAVLSYHLWLYSFAWGGTQSTLFYAGVKAMAGVSILRTVDDLVYTRIDTEKLLRENPIAYAIYILAYAIVIGSGFGV